MIRQPKCASVSCTDSFSPKATAAVETFLWNSTRIRSRRPLPVQSESPFPEAGTGIPIFRFRTGQATLSRFTRLSCFDHYQFHRLKLARPLESVHHWGVGEFSVMETNYNQSPGWSKSVLPLVASWVLPTSL